MENLKLVPNPERAARWRDSTQDPLSRAPTLTPTPDITPSPDLKGRTRLFNRPIGEILKNMGKESALSVPIGVGVGMFAGTVGITGVAFGAGTALAAGGIKEGIKEHGRQTTEKWARIRTEKNKKYLFNPVDFWRGFLNPDEKGELVKAIGKGAVKGLAYRAVLGGLGGIAGELIGQTPVGEAAGTVADSFREFAGQKAGELKNAIGSHIPGGEASSTPTPKPPELPTSAVVEPGKVLIPVFGAPLGASEAVVAVYQDPEFIKGTNEIIAQQLSQVDNYTDQVLKHGGIDPSALSPEALENARAFVKSDLMGITEGTLRSVIYQVDAPGSDIHQILALGKQEIENFIANDDDYYSGGFVENVKDVIGQIPEPAFPSVPELPAAEPVLDLPAPEVPELIGPPTVGPELPSPILVPYPGAPEAFVQVVQDPEFIKGSNEIVSQYLHQGDIYIDQALVKAGIDPSSLSEEALIRVREVTRDNSMYLADTYLNNDTVRGVAQGLDTSQILENIQQSLERIVNEHEPFSYTDRFIEQVKSAAGQIPEIPTPTPIPTELPTPSPTVIPSPTTVPTPTDVLPTSTPVPTLLPTEVLPPSTDEIFTQITNNPVFEHQVQAAVAVHLPDQVQPVVQHKMEALANASFERAVHEAAGRGSVNMDEIIQRGNELYSQILIDQQDQLNEIAKQAVALPVPETAPQVTVPEAPEIPAPAGNEVLDSISPDMFKEVNIPKGGNVGQLLVNAGHSITWGPQDAELFGAHIEANYDLLNNTWNQMIENKMIPPSEFPIPRAELSDLIEKAKAGDTEALKKLTAALKWVPEGGQFKILNSAGISSLIGLLR